MPFQDPRVQLPKDGERVQFKLTGVPTNTGVPEPTLGRFYAPEPGVVHADGYLGTFRTDRNDHKPVDQQGGYHYNVWAQNEYEVAAWRPIDEYHKELH